MRVGLLCIIIILSSYGNAPAQTRRPTAKPQGSETVEIVVDPFVQDKVTEDTGPSATPVKRLRVESQEALIREGRGKQRKIVSFRLYNNTSSNVRNVDINVIPDPMPMDAHINYSRNKVFSNTARCKVITGAIDGILKIHCDYIGATGVVGFAVTSAVTAALNGKVTLATPDDTVVHRF